jgi:alpha-galactosidase
VLDLSHPEVSDHVFRLISAVLDDLPLSYLKWDHNRDLTHAGATPRYRQQVLAAYALMDRFRARYPHVEIEACAGGGGRIDAGIAARTHRFWPSDNLDAVARHAIQQGFLQFMPPELMGSHVGTAPAHSTGRRQPLDFRCALAMTGAFGLEFDIRRLSDNDRLCVVDAISHYKRHRNLLHGGRLWRGEAGDGLSWQAHGDADQLFLQILRSRPATQRFAVTIPLPMLAPNRRYRLSDLDGRPLGEQAGGWLVQQGLSVPLMPPESAAHMLLSAI